MKKPGIYVISDFDSGCSYIGSSLDLNKRLKTHLQLLKNNNHHNYKLQKIFNKGNELFVKPIVTAPDVDIRKLEQSLIDEFYDTGILLNISRDTIAPTANASEETRLKMSNSKKKLYLEHPEILTQMSNTKKQQFIDNPELRIQCGIHNRGRKHTPEVIEYCKMVSELNSPPRKVSIDGIIYPSIKEAARATGIPKTTIRYKLIDDKITNFIEIK